MKENHVKIGELNIPVDYFKLTQDEKEDMCVKIIDMLSQMILARSPKYLNHIMVMNKLLESSIITNNEEENYEVSAILSDCYKLINEEKN